MANIDDILVTNLTETLRQLQKYMLWSLWGAVFYLALGTYQPRQVEIPTAVIPLTVSLQVAIAISSAVYWFSGALVWLGMGRVNRITNMLAEREGGRELITAVLTYPSIPTTRAHAPRIGLAILPSLFVILGTFIQTERISYHTIVGLMILVGPNLSLALCFLAAAVGGGRPGRYGD